MEVTAEFSDASSTVSAGRTEITCRLCRNHGIRSLMKSHRGCCPYESCLCSQCLQVLKKRMKSKTQRRDKGTSYEQGGTDLLNPLFPQSEKPNVSSDAASQGSCINGSQDSADISSNRLIQKPREATVKCENLQRMAFSSTISTNRRVGGMLGFDHVKSEATENTAVNLEGLPQSGKQTNVKAEVVATSSKTQHRFETVSQKSSACSAVASSSRAQAGLGDVSERFPASLNKQKGSQSIVSVPTTSASCLGQLLTAGHSQNGNSIFRNNLNNGFPSIPYSYNVTRETESTQKLRPHLIDSVGNYQSSWYQQRVREGWIASHYPLYSQTGRTPLFGSGSWPNSSQFGHSNGNCFPPPYFNSSRFQTVSMNDITAWNQQARFPRNIMTIPQHYYAQIPRFS
ncbi:hypothetical protein AB6A40_008601 [Gnathostoma spinigerum]|uniref:DM domain-containing protein n=1 Tax=Gnathostoma spinigerum TaxID=75299 RepID=A0ABD6EZ43_9BILA